jgi:Na+-driven multidrug efflux pump
MYITDPALATSGANMFRIMMGAFFIQGFILLPATLFQSIGKGGTASFLLLAREILLFVPIVVVLPLFMGLNGIWLSIPLADALIAVLAIILFVIVFRSMGVSHQENMP